MIVTAINSTNPARPTNASKKRAFHLVNLLSNNHCQGAALQLLACDHTFAGAHQHQSATRLNLRDPRRHFTHTRRPLACGESIPVDHTSLHQASLMVITRCASWLTSSSLTSVRYLFAFSASATTFELCWLRTSELRSG